MLKNLFQGFVQGFLVDAATKGSVAVFKKVDSDSQCEKLFRSAVLECANENMSYEPIFNKAKAHLLNKVVHSESQPFYEAEYINKTNLFNFINTTCLRKDINKRTYQDELTKFEDCMTSGKNFKEVFNLEHTFENNVELKRVLNYIKDLLKSAEIAYENSHKLVNPISRLICKMEDESSVLQCLRGLFHCQSILICDNKLGVRFRKLMDCIFENRLSETLSLLGKYSNKSTENVSLREKRMITLAQNIDFEFAKKSNVFEVYKLIFKVYLLSKTIDQDHTTDTTADEIFTNLTSTVSEDFSDHYLILEMFGNMDINSYPGYRRYLLK